MKQRARLPVTLPSRLRLLIAALAIVFLAELVAEETLEFLLSLLLPWRERVTLEIINAALLAFLIAPVLWWFAIRPLRRIAVAHLQAATVLAQAADGIITINAQGLVQSFNKAAEHNFEYTAGEVIGKPVTLLMPERYRDAHHGGFDRVRAGGEPRLLGKTVELHGLTKNGREFPIELSLTTWKAGRDAFFTAIVRNITERKRMEDAAREAQESLHALIQASPLPITAMDPEGTVRLWNPAAERILGWREEEVLGRSLPIVPAGKQEEFRALRERVIQGEGLAGTEVRRQKKDGTPLDVAIWAAPLHDSNGHSTGIMAVVADITERKRAEERLRLQSAALEAAANAVLITDREGCITWVNPAFTRLTGYIPEEVIGRSPHVLKSGKHPQAFYRTLWDTILAGQVWQREMVNRRKDGSLFTEEQTITPVRGERAEITHFVSINHDITQRKQAEEALAERTRQLEAIRAVTAEITRELDLTALLELITRRAAELVGVGTGAVYLWDEASQRLVTQAWIGYGAWRGDVRMYLVGEGVAGTVAQRREGMIVNDYRTSLYAAHPFLEHARSTAVLAEPLLYADRLLGVIVVSNDGTDRRFTDEDGNILRLFASQAAIAIENVRLYSAAEARADELRTLREIDQAIRARLDLPAVLYAVVAGAMKLLGTQHTQIILWDEANRTLHYGAALGTGADRVRSQHFELGKGIIGLVAQTRQPMMVNDYQASSYALPEFSDVVATLTVPILFEDRLLGVLHSHTTTPGKGFKADDLRRFSMLASQAAIAIENARLFDQVARGKAEWEQTFDSLSDSVALIDAEYRLVRVNRALAARLNTTPGALVGQPCYAALHGVETPWVGCPHHHTLTTGKAMTQEVEDPGLGKTFLVTTSPVGNGEGQARGCVYIARDVTALKHLEAEAQQRQRFEDLSRAKSGFITTMSHELRTPLNSILGFSQLLLEQTATLLSEKQGRYLAHIHQSGQHLLQLITDILDLSKVEAGKLVLEPQILPVASTLEDTLVIARGLANKKGQEIGVEIEPDLPSLRADPVRLKQILFNLLSNGVKFTPEHGRITVTARAVTEDRRPETGSAPGFPSPVGWLEIAVRDTGVGIKAEDLPRLFEEFVQLEATATMHHEGTGLGLALTKRLVELHGGRIWAESEGKGRGSTFTVVLPFFFKGPGEGEGAKRKT